MPVLQVALDLMQLNRSIVIAHEAVDGGADWIEAGTPLIKSEGAEAVRALRREFPGKKIIADTKTMDVGSFEVEIMAKAGADIVTVLGLADDATIEEAVMAGRKYGAEIMIDMINVPDRVQRAKEVEKLGAAYICMHMGIDTQMRGEEPPIDVLRKIVDAVSIPVAVAGGITAENAGEYVEAGATDVIVGGAIIKTEDIRGAAENVKKAMAGAKVDTNLAKKYSEEDLFEAFSRVSTCNISDAFHKQSRRWSAGRSPSRPPTATGRSPWRPSTVPRRATSSSSTLEARPSRYGESWPHAPPWSWGSEGSSSTVP